MITIKIDAKRVENMISGYTRTIPEATDRGVYNLAKYGVKTILDSAKEAGINYWGGGKRELFSQTRYQKTKKGEYVIKMPIHGVYLDRMRPHWVSLKRGRLITKWAQSKPNLRHLVGGAIIVRKHPFIAKGVTKIVNKAKGIVENEINKAVRRKGR